MTREGESSGEGFPAAALYGIIGAGCVLVIVAVAFFMCRGKRREVRRRTLATLGPPLALLGPHLVILGRRLAILGPPW